MKTSNCKLDVTLVEKIVDRLQDRKRVFALAQAISAQSSGEAVMESIPGNLCVNNIDNVDFFACGAPKPYSCPDGTADFTKRLFGYKLLVISGILRFSSIAEHQSVFHRSQTA